MDIPFWFWTSVITAVASTVIALINAFVPVGLGPINPVRIIIYFTCIFTWLLGSWGVIGFGIAWFIQFLNS